MAAYVDVDGEASLTGLLAYLQAEIDTGTGLDRAVPSDREAVKLLTVHKAKGLEWEVVFLPALMQGIFPSDRVTDNWVTNPAVLPADLRGDAASIPQLADASNSAISAYKARLSEQQQLAEDRLAYVGVTRAKQLLVGSGHTWRAELVKPRTPSTYLRSILEAARAQDQVLAEASPAGAVNPLVVDAVPQPWPAPLDPDALRRRQEAASGVLRARDRFTDTGHVSEPQRPSGTVPMEPALLVMERKMLRGIKQRAERLHQQCGARPRLTSRSPSRVAEGDFCFRGSPARRAFCVKFYSATDGRQGIGTTFAQAISGFSVRGKRPCVDVVVDALAQNLDAASDLDRRVGHAACVGDEVGVGGDGIRLLAAGAVRPVEVHGVPRARREAPDDDPTTQVRTRLPEEPRAPRPIRDGGTDLQLADCDARA